MDLIAIWNSPQPYYLAAPDSVRWADGNTATIEDYENHCNDTARLIDLGALGVRMYIWPDVVAEVYWCPFSENWGLRGYGVIPQGLSLFDREATDDQIAIAMTVLQIRYRYEVVRPSEISP